MILLPGSTVVFTGEHGSDTQRPYGVFRITGLRHFDCAAEWRRYIEQAGNSIISPSGFARWLTCCRETVEVVPAFQWHFPNGDRNHLKPL